MLELFFFKKVTGLRAGTLSKKRIWHMFTPANFAKIPKNAFFTEHLWATASVSLKEKEEIAKEFRIRKVAWQLYDCPMKKGTPLQVFFKT